MCWRDEAGLAKAGLVKTSLVKVSLAKAGFANADLANADGDKAKCLGWLISGASRTHKAYRTI
jgi:hypothetical protein